MGARMQGWVATAVAGAVVGLVVPLGALATSGAASATPGGGTGTGPGTPCVEVTHPLGGATGWTEFVEGNGHRGSESEGTVAYGGDFRPQWFPVGGALRHSLPKTAAALVVAGRAGSFNLNAGSAWVGPGQPADHTINFNSGGTLLDTNPVDFPGAFASLRDRSTAWGTAAQTGTVASTSDEVRLVLTGTDPRLNVFTLAPAQVTGGVAIDVPAGSTALVNVAGTSVQVGGKMKLRVGGSWRFVSDDVIRDVSAPTVLWNFPTATSVTLGGNDMWGGVFLAPRAALEVATSTSYTVGQVVASSFTSFSETHPASIPAKLCLPGTPEDPQVPEPGKPDVTVVKSASVASPRGGDRFDYVLTVRNVGSAPAPGVVVRDPLPAGVGLVSATSPCAAAGSVVTCALGTLEAGDTRTLTLSVLAAPIAGSGRPRDDQARHHVTVTKEEQHVDLEPGQLRTVHLACREPGAILTDGSLRVDHVDQGTGALTDVRVLAAHSTGVSSWKAVVRNDATGRAQAKAYAVCLPPSTEADRGHRHELVAEPTVLTTTLSPAAGRSSATLTCAPGSLAIAPGHSFGAGTSRLVGLEKVGSGWRFTVDLAEPSSVALSVRCLRGATGPSGGHTHPLATTHVVRTMAVPAGGVAEEQVSCPDDAKGIVATWDLPTGVHPLGNDPRVKSRTFRLLNTTGTTLTATVDLECLGDRTEVEEMGTDDPVRIDNTATVSTTAPEADATNNTATATVSVTPGSTTAVPAAAAGLAGRTLTLPVVSSMPGSARVVLRSGGQAVGRAKVSLRPGGVTTARVPLTKAGRKAVRRAGRAFVVVDPARGPATRRTVRVR